jgi:hypothetical protein
MNDGSRARTCYVVFSPTPKAKIEAAGKTALGASYQRRDEVGLFHTLSEELRAGENKFFNYFRIPASSFDEHFCLCMYHHFYPIISSFNQRY